MRAWVSRLKGVYFLI